MPNLAHIRFVGVDVPPPPVRNRSASDRAAPSGRSRAQPRQPVDHAVQLDPFLAWLLQRAGLDASAYRPNALHRRLAACLRHCQTSAPETARAMVEEKPELISALLNRVLIGVSTLFRDQAIFDHLRDTVLPELLRVQHGLRVYSAGTADGQELVSIAILLTELGALDRSKLFGIDCRPDAIANARTGVFSEADLKTIAPDYHAKYFSAAGREWSVRPELQRAIEWRAADLTTFRSETTWDLILFRNVSIYLEEPHATKAWANLCDQLRPGGFVVTGTSEKPPAALPLTRMAAAIYRKTER